MLTSILRCREAPRADRGRGCLPLPDADFLKPNAHCKPYPLSSTIVVCTHTHPWQSLSSRFSPCSIHRMCRTYGSTPGMLQKTGKNSKVQPEKKRKRRNVRTDSARKRTEESLKIGKGGFVSGGFGRCGHWAGNHYTIISETISAVRFLCNLCFNAPDTLAVTWTLRKKFPNDFSV